MFTLTVLCIPFFLWFFFFFFAKVYYCVFTGRTGAEAEAPIPWPPNAKNWLTGKDPDGGKDWRQEEKGTTENEMVGWHQQLNGHEFEQAPGVDDWHGHLECCSPWGYKESDTTERLHWTDSLFQDISGFAGNFIFLSMKNKLSLFFLHSWMTV